MSLFEETRIAHSELPSKLRDDEALASLSSFLEDNWQLRSLLYNDGRRESSQQFLSFGKDYVRTNQYIGTIIYRGERLDIFPKVFKNEESSDAGVMYQNILNWIGYCDKESFPCVSSDACSRDAADSLTELLISIYIRYVEYIVSRNLYYQYEEKTEDLHLIKGRFDVSDYLRVKIPGAKSHSFSCTFSEFESDNAVNRIIKAVLKKLFNRTTSVSSKKLIRVLLQKFSGVSDVVCHPSDCDRIHVSRNRAVYSMIISMSKMFLLGGSISQDSSGMETFCFLFPADVLFEGFVGGVIRKAFDGISVKLQKNGPDIFSHIFFNGTWSSSLFNTRYDIWIERKTEEEKRVLILDTKYKTIPRFEGNDSEIRDILRDNVSQADIYQVLQYAQQEGASDVCLVYPQMKDEKCELYFPYGVSTTRDGRTIKVHFLRVPFACGGNEFAVDVVDRIKGIIKPFIMPNLSCEE